MFGVFEGKLSTCRGKEKEWVDCTESDFSEGLASLLSEELRWRKKAGSGTVKGCDGLLGCLEGKHWKGTREIKRLTVRVHNMDCIASPGENHSS